MKSKAFQLISSTRAIIAFIFLALVSVQASAGTLLPNGKQIFFNNDGSPCVGCKVYFYIPSTTTPKDTYQDSGQTILNSNPVVLDSAGTAVIYGSGIYRQIFKDSLGNTIWDKLTSDSISVGSVEFAGTSTGSGNAQAVTAGNFTGSNGQAIAFYAGFTNTASMTLTVSGGSPIVVRKDTSAGGPVTLDGGEVTAGNLVVVYYDSVGGYFHMVSNASVAQLNNVNTFSSVQTFTSSPVFSNGVSSTVGPIEAPCGRLTLTSATPVLSNDVTAATTVYYTPYICNMISLYDGSKWNTVSFSEVSQTLSDSTKSPSAAGVSQIYDMFGWLDGSTFRVTRGPTWATGGGSSTARGTGAGSTELERISGILLNKYSITNGPSADRGIYLGTISTDANGANGQMNMMFLPTAAAGGTNNRLDVWNAYNRVMFSSLCRDSTDSWTYAVATWRSLNNNNANRISYVTGGFGTNIEAKAITNAAAVNAYAVSGGVGFDSTSSASNNALGTFSTTGSAVDIVSGISLYSGNAGTGFHFVQHLENSLVAGSVSFKGDNGNPSLYQSGLTLRLDM